MWHDLEQGTWSWNTGFPLDSNGTWTMRWVITRCSTDDKMQIAGWSRTLLFWSTVRLQICECTNIQLKHSEIVIWMLWTRAQRSETWNIKEIRRKGERNKIYIRKS